MITVPIVLISFTIGEKSSRLYWTISAFIPIGKDRDLGPEASFLLGFFFEKYKKRQLNLFMD